MMLSRRLILLLLICTLPGCSQLTYYAQAAKGQLQILRNRQGIDKLLEDANLSARLIEQLELVRNIRNFASAELDLPDNSSFRTYSDIERKHVVWNVIATPEFDIEPKTWCFPIAGCVSYKGYFAEADAAALNRDLMKQGYDTFMYGVSAYSTLGWFADPVLSTFVNYNEISLAGLIFHELAHQVVYVKDDSGFNEAFTTAVEYAGIEKWLFKNKDTNAVASYRLRQHKNDAITEMVLEYRNTLSMLYKKDTESNVSEKKHKLIDEMRNRYTLLKEQGNGTAFYDWWFDHQINNAHFTSIAIYHRLVPGFLEELNEHDTFEQFFKVVTSRAKQSKSERNKWLQRLIAN